MKLLYNFSTNGEPIRIEAGVKYIVIDALYLNDIKEKELEINTIDYWQKVKNELFPYTDFPFAEIVFTTDTLHINQIKKIDYEEFAEDPNLFSTDTGLILVLKDEILDSFLKKYDYEKLVDCMGSDFVNLAYLQTVADNFNLTDLAIIAAPGIDTDFDFDGSGTYSVVQNSIEL
jgi:hypothetical protein